MQNGRNLPPGQGQATCPLQPGQVKAPKTYNSGQVIASFASTLICETGSERVMPFGFPELVSEVSWSIAHRSIWRPRLEPQAGQA